MFNTDVLAVGELDGELGARRRPPKASAIAAQRGRWSFRLLPSSPVDEIDPHATFRGAIRRRGTPLSAVRTTPDFKLVQMSHDHHSGRDW